MSNASKRSRFWVMAAVATALVAATAAAGDPAAGQQEASLLDLSSTLTLPILEGQAVATCFSDFNIAANPSSGLATDSPVVALVDVRDPKAFPISPGQNWGADIFHNDASSQKWNALNLGQVFGITLDGESPPNVYVAASTTYGLFRSPSGPVPGMLGLTGGAGTVYRLDGVTGAILPYAHLPNGNAGSADLVGPGLGDVAYHREHDQFFVTNFEDGLIYRLPGPATNPSLPVSWIGSPFNHCQALGRPYSDGGIMSAAYSSHSPSGNSGFARLGCRPWAVETFEGRLYYSVWANDARNDGRSDPNEIYSIGISSVDGSLVGQPVLEVSLGQTLTKGSGPSLAFYSSPISDLAFAADGRMLISERTMSNSDVGPNLVSASVGHRSRVLELSGASQGWDVANPKIYHVGAASIAPITQPPLTVGALSVRANAEGGADYGFETFQYVAGQPVAERACDESVWATGEQLLGPSNALVYGLAGLPPSGNTFGTATNVYAIDLNNNLTVLDKSRIGDVEVFRRSCKPPCGRIIDVELTCVTDRPGGIFVQVTIVNETPDDIVHVFLSNLPAGVFAPFGDHLDFSADPIVPGETVTISFSLVGLLPGSAASFQLSLHNENLERCCSIPVTIDIPTCDCGQLLDSSLTCIAGAPPSYDLSFLWQHLAGVTGAHLFVVPSPGQNLTVTPAVFNQSLVYGQTLSGTVSISGPDAVPGARICLLFSTHDERFRECCSVEQCFTLPGTDFCVFPPDDP
ncbi:MAG TPA: hypothetical protein VF017_01410 [Thermoanaerobaculia bacterium]|nr:hypothetical protein [Thermoanaerobaculia bacterium]